MSTIPKNWKVRITDSNREILESWRIQQPDVDKNPKITCFNEGALNHWLISDRFDGTYMNWGLGENHIEITFKQFEQFIYGK